MKIAMALRNRSNTGAPCSRLTDRASAASDSPALHYPAFREGIIGGRSSSEPGSDVLVGCMRWLGCSIRSHDGRYFPSRLYALKVMMRPMVSKKASTTMNTVVLVLADCRW